MTLRDVAVTLTLSVFAMLGHTSELQAQEPIPQGVPDLIIHNAKIITVDDPGYNSNPGTIAQAMAVRNGVIQGLGNNNDILAMRGPDTRVMDMQGRTIMPGFVNVHHHPQSSMEDIAREEFDLPGALEGYYINLVVARNPDETLAKIADAVEVLRSRAQVEQTDWIGIELLPDGEHYPDLGSVSFMMSSPDASDVQIGTSDLSEIIPTNPAVLMSGANIHIRGEEPGVWFRVTQAQDGSPIIEQLFTFEFSQ